MPKSSKDMRSWTYARLLETGKNVDLAAIADEGFPIDLKIPPNINLLQIVIKRTDIKSNIQMAVIDRLLKNPNVDPNQLDLATGKNPLYSAINSENINLFNSLIAQPKVNINIADDTGRSPLYYAVKAENVHMVKVLLEKGADARQIFNGRSLNEIAKKNKNEDIAKLLPKIKTYRKKEHSQTFLINPMRKLGYRSDKGGICFGVAHMGMQAALNENQKKNKYHDIESFNKRINRIKAIPEETIAEQIKQVKEKRGGIAAKIRREVNGLTENDINTELRGYNLEVLQNQRLSEINLEEKKKWLVEAKIEEEVNLTFTEGEKIDLSISPFFDGVELYHQSRLYRYLFEKGEKPGSLMQSGQLTMPLVSSVELDKNGGAVNIDRFSGVYDEKEAAIYFNRLKSVLEKHPPFDHPVSLILNSNRHSISVSYDPDPEHRGWFLIDANQLPAKKYYPDEDIAKKVISALSKNGTGIFSSEIYVGEKNRHALKERLDILHQDSSWKKIHEVTAKKAQATDSGGGMWLDVATGVGDVETAKKLMSKGGIAGFFKRNKVMAILGVVGIVGVVTAVSVATLGAAPLAIGLAAAGAALVFAAGSLITDRLKVQQAKSEKRARDKALEIHDKKVTPAQDNKVNPIPQVATHVQAPLPAKRQDPGQLSTTAMMNTQLNGNAKVNTNASASSNNTPEIEMDEKISHQPKTPSALHQELMKPYHSYRSSDERSNFINPYLKLSQELQKEVLLRFQTTEDLKILKGSISRWPFFDNETERKNVTALLDEVILLKQPYHSFKNTSERGNFIKTWLALPEHLQEKSLTLQSLDDLKQLSGSFARYPFNDKDIKEKSIAIVNNIISEKIPRETEYTENIFQPTRRP